MHGDATATRIAVDPDLTDHPLGCQPGDPSRSTHCSHQLLATHSHTDAGRHRHSSWCGGTVLTNLHPLFPLLGIAQLPQSLGNLGNVGLETIGLQQHRNGRGSVVLQRQDQVSKTQTAGHALGEQPFATNVQPPINCPVSIDGSFRVPQSGHHAIQLRPSHLGRSFEVGIESHPFELRSLGRGFGHLPTNQFSHLVTTRPRLGGLGDDQPDRQIGVQTRCNRRRSSSSARCRRPRDLSGNGQPVTGRPCSSCLRHRATPDNPIADGRECRKFVSDGLQFDPQGFVLDRSLQPVPDGSRHHYPATSRSFFAHQRPDVAPGQPPSIGLCRFSLQLNILVESASSRRPVSQLKPSRPAWTSVRSGGGGQTASSHPPAW
ncbi:MAG: hypothetical protein CM1200mP2_34130 [Planctomycetaceae bacterium]|nr:MAG: hypothetical protein CM1200mP2_34130 [Planctomycetaceae bacterium]